MAQPPNKKLFVVGDPIDHSRSPLIHAHWLDIHNLVGSYERLCISPSDFSNFFQELKQSGEWSGGNITIPHKESVYGLVDECDSVAHRIGAVNTVWSDNGRWHGSNTDSYGFLANMDERAVGWDSADKLPRTALILGSGGASRAVIDALFQRGFERITLTNRTGERAVALAQHLSCVSVAWGEVPSDTGLIVNATSVGMNDHPPIPPDVSPDILPIDISSLPSDCVVCDLVYTPLCTGFLRVARQHNLKTVDGLGMLLHQAAPGFEKWFGVRPKVSEELRCRLLRDLGELPKHSGSVKFLGLTGSIGMGKTTTAAMFADLGVPVCDLDSIVHDLYRGEAVALVESAFPGTTKSGEVDRVALSTAVVGDSEKLKKLELLLHPLLESRQQSFRDRVCREEAPLAIFDSPLLFEQGAHEQMDAVIVATAPPEVQRERVLSRPHMSESKFASLLSRQWSDEKKRENADYIVDTSLGFDAVRGEVKRIVSEFTPDE